MKIRAVTSFYDPNATSDLELQDLAKCSHEIVSSLESEGYIIQSQRVATSPFPNWLHGETETEWLNQIDNLVKTTTRLGWQYTSIGAASPADLIHFKLIPSILSLNPALFAAGIISTGIQLFPQAVSAAATVIVENAQATTDGFTNLRFAALANVEAYAPFLPAAYARHNEQPGIALAIECADEAVNSFGNAKSLVEARGAFLQRLEENATTIETICNMICKNHKVDFKGFDFSPAPYPEDWCSLGGAMESLGVPGLGMSGSLAAAAYVASTLDLGKWKRIGFNGLMLPVLEDSILAERAASGVLTLKDMLLYSAVCGTGLDTIPLAGNTSTDQLAAILLDLGALAIRLNKPLTGRLMPIPGKVAGDCTDFDFEFFANSRVMALDAKKIGAPMADAPVIEISPREAW